MTLTCTMEFYSQLLSRIRDATVMLTQHEKENAPHFIREHYSAA
jgi:hypothetical protein